MENVRSTVVGGVLVLAGVALGALVFRSEPAGAQTSGYRECVLGRQESLDINNEGRWERAGDANWPGNNRIAVPNGWEVVGGAGTGGLGGILICRR